MVFKHLKLHQFLMVWYERFLHTSMGVGRGQEFEKFCKKGCFLSFEWQKTNFTTFGRPLEKLLEKSTSGPPGKNLSNAHAHKHVKLHHF